MKVFFKPDADVNGQPAWFRYWSAGAVPGLSGFTYASSIPGSAGALGRYDCTFSPFLGSFYAFDCLPKNEELWIASGAYTTTTPKLSKGISGKPLKVVAAVVEHELDHQSRRNNVNNQVQMLWDNWWSSLNMAQKAGWLAQGTTAGNQKVLYFWDLVDSDRDAVSNGLDPTDLIDSDHDDEVEAEKAMGGSSRDKDKDWSNGGEQW